MQKAEVLIHFRKHTQKQSVQTFTDTNTHYAMCCEGVIIYAAVFLSSAVRRAERPDHRSTAILALGHILPHRERGTDLLSARRPSQRVTVRLPIVILKVKLWM